MAAVRLDVRCTKLHMLTCTAVGSGVLIARTDLWKTNSFFVLFSEGKANTGCRKQSSIILTKPKLNQESCSDFKYLKTPFLSEGGL